MKNIKRFQRFMLTLLVGVNVFFYAIKTNHEFSKSIALALFSMMGMYILILIYAQTKKSKLSSKIHVSKSRKDNTFIL
jgi:hypothetical protein